MEKAQKRKHRRERTEEKDDKKPRGRGGERRGQESVAISHW